MLADMTSPEPGAGSPTPEELTGAPSTNGAPDPLAAASTASPRRVPEHVPDSPNLPDPTPNPSAEGLRTAASSADVRRWRGYLTAERAEAAVYRDLASRREGEERDILLALAEAEKRHERHWLDLLGPAGAKPTRLPIRTRVLGWFARRFGSVFVLALVQRAETRSEYATERDATPQMVADERIHAEVVRTLAARGRASMSGGFRAAVFGMNDGLVSNLALVLGIGATGVAPGVVLVTGLAGLLAGALSMGAGEYVSVRSQRELLEASTPDPLARTMYPHLDIDDNELALVYRARGESPQDARIHAERSIRNYRPDAVQPRHLTGEYEEIGSPWTAAFSSFGLFAAGAIIPVLPYLFGMSGLPAVFLAAGLVGVALLVTGGIVGILSGGPPLRRGLRQLAIGWGAAAVTYLLGLAFGTTVT
ncbi:VIT1/CCC1 family predicted Fe2+/Mn2+ transporter [Salana multivorans]|uniref:VIT1/CCC1 family predicted Fe2+/Mn2+ transporter n=2 Tax=Salana multivorans TaxID=120377 RepID=A0A3N2DB65_9MICO|nr:VIT1/CCC1 family predicted Fe2+/Mn2+ transporter [Salana multivorans]